MKYFVVLVLVVVSGCAGSIKPEQWGECDKLCKANSGIDYMFVNGFADYYSCYCKNTLKGKIRNN